MSDQGTLPETLTLEEAAALLHMHKETLREKAAANQIPGGRKPGRRWVFSKAALLSWLAGDLTKSVEQPASGVSLHPDQRLLRSSPKDRHAVEREYRELLGLDKPPTAGRKKAPKLTGSWE